MSLISHVCPRKFRIRPRPLVSIYRSLPAIKSCRAAKTPSEFYLSFHPSSYPATMEENPATSVGFPSPSRSSGDQTLIGLDSVFCSSPYSCLTKSSFSFLSFVRIWRNEATSTQSRKRFSCLLSTLSLHVTRQQLVDRINEELNRFLMTRASSRPLSTPTITCVRYFHWKRCALIDINSIEG